MTQAHGPNKSTSKVGDWVVYDTEVSQIRDIDGDFIITDKSSSRMYEPWQQAKGEWCVFWDNDFTHYEVGQYLHTTNGSHYFDDGAINRDNIAPLEFIQTLKNK